ncbi:MAG: M23 family metallopeptidase, partial [Desulfosalsimonas sp.]
ESSASLVNTLGLVQAEAESGRAAAAPPEKVLPENPPANPAAQTPWDQEFGHLLSEKTLKVNPGDTVINILVRAGLSGPEANRAVRALRQVFNPSDLKMDHEVAVGFVDTEYAGSVFQRLRLKTGYDREYQVVRGANTGYSARQVQPRIKTRPARAEAEIKSSLYKAATDADLPLQALMQVLRAYSYDVDFQRDIQPGDSLEILYEEKLDQQGNTVATGNVLFAALHTNGKSLRIYRHKADGDGSAGFYDEAGQSVRKALMVTPVEGGRVSSGYGMRKHPILGYNKMHEGLDFAAPKGTPVMAAGDGVVEYAGRNGSYGHYIRIRHPNSYKTIYAHLSGYADNVKSGARVEQGETIGYVGSTGRSTGPHLHYEVLQAGNSVDPSRMETKPGRSLEGKDLERFMAAKAQLEELYASLGAGTKLAAADRALQAADR